MVRHVELNISLFFRWLNKLGLASIQYEPAERNTAAGEFISVGKREGLFAYGFRDRGADL